MGSRTERNGGARLVHRRLGRGAAASRRICPTHSATPATTQPGQPRGQPSGRPRTDSQRAVHLARPILPPSSSFVRCIKFSPCTKNESVFVVLQVQLNGRLCIFCDPNDIIIEDFMTFITKCKKRINCPPLELKKK